MDAATLTLLEFAEEVRRSGDTRLASMAIAVINTAKSQAPKVEPMTEAHEREWRAVVKVAQLGVQGRVPVRPLTILAVNERLSRVPQINYDALIAAAAVSNKTWTPGKTGCVAFARGAEWFRREVHIGLDAASASAHLKGKQS